MSKISELIPDAKNANKGTPRGLKALDDSLREGGAGRSILADKHGVIIAGNKTMERCADIGIDDTIVVESDGTKLVVVKRTDLDLETDPQARRLAYADNRVGQLDLDFDPDQIMDDLKAGVDFDGLFTDIELEDFGWEPDKAEDPGADMDRADELQEKWQVQRGQVWAVGKHRVMCGDSTDAADVAKLMGGERAALALADPPYNVGVGYDAKVNDSKPEAEYEVFARKWFGLWCSVSDKQIVTPGCNNLARWLRYFEPYHVAPWIKTNSMTNGKVSRFWCWEPTVFFGEPDDWSWEGIIFFGEKWERRRANDVFNFPIGEQGGVGDHPCPKPLKMWADLTAKYAKLDGIVVDPFLGSGTTIVACEQTGRIGYGMEIAEKYVAVTLERLAGMGLEPELTETNTKELING